MLLQLPLRTTVRNESPGSQERERERETGICRNLVGEMSKRRVRC